MRKTKRTGSGSLNVDPAVVADWMVDRLDRWGEYYQEVAVFEIAQKFGDSVWYTNRHGNPAIEKDILDEFRDLTEGEVVWDRSEQTWRKRKPYDPPDGRMVSS